ncbi:hypothetical protein C4572_03000 [Candidatus Parcubacteria bacterium]|nr:MAG: hypothetical protein C4572_03000 [Candidatus Parcubacteria bacterium]
MKRKNGQEVKTKRDKAIYFLYLLILFLLLSNFFTYFLKSTPSKTTEDEFKFLNPARKFVRQEDLIVNFQPLRDYLNDKYEADPNVSVYFEYLPTGSNIAISKDAEFYPASLLKVPISMAVGKKIEKGEWKWTNELVLMSTDKDVKFGNLYKKPVGSTFTIEELARNSLADSDNTAHFILLRNLEMTDVNDVYEHIGLKGFMDTDGSISAT